MLLNRFIWISLIFMLACGNRTFQVTKISYEPPSWLTSPVNDKVLVIFTFNQKVDRASVIPQTTMQVNLKNWEIGRPAQQVSNIAGALEWSADDKAVVFISTNTLQDLVKVQNGDQIAVSIYLAAEPFGADVVKSIKGVVLDGDKDKKPGGSFGNIKNLRYRQAKNRLVDEP